MSIRFAGFMLIWALVSISCSSEVRPLPPPCVSDSECSSGQLCFAEGCADPGKGLVAEITSGTFNGQWPQDIAIKENLKNAYDFQLPLPNLLKGEFQQQKTASAMSTDRLIYSRPVIVRAVGESVLIPGVVRSFRQSFEKPERGYFEMTLGTGKFTVTATPEDTSLPPVTIRNVTIASNEPELPSFPITFPAVEGGLSVSGRVLQRINYNVVPAIEDPLVGVRVDIQVFDPLTRAAISQRFPVSSVGDFSITLDPDALTLREVLFVVSPRTNDDIAPVREFAVSVPFAQVLNLEFGDFGTAQELKGRVIDHVGSPVAGAQVLVDGSLGSGVHFRSKLSITSTDGSFSVLALPTALSGQLSVVIVPPAAQGASAVTLPVKLTAGSNQLDASPSEFRCPKRVSVKGSIVSIDNEPAASTSIKATYQSSANTSTVLAIDDVIATANAAGEFELLLDQGMWRIEVDRSGSPLASRLIEVKRIDDKGDAISDQVIPPITLSRGLKISGAITQMSANGQMGVQASARIRFFRVTTVNRTSVSIFLGSSVTDSNGHYDVLLPAK